MHDRYEYKLVSMPSGISDIYEIEMFLDKYGDDGWELTCHDYGCFIFKRKLV